MKLSANAKLAQVLVVLVDVHKPWRKKLANVVQIAVVVTPALARNSSYISLFHVGYLTDVKPSQPIDCDASTTARQLFRILLSEARI